MNDIIGIPQYPWTEGDRLYASALNAAIADGPYLANSGINNGINFGADPTGVADSTAAINEALATGHATFLPAGTYLITGQLHVGSQTFYGVGANTILLIDSRFDPTVTTGVINVGYTGGIPQVSDMTIQFVQPVDLVTTAAAHSAPGATTIIVASTAGIQVGMSVVDRTARPGGLVASTYFQGRPATTVISIAGTLLTLNRPVIDPGVAIGDTLQFASVRSMFKTLAAGGTTTPGGTGVQYPWAIYTGAACRVRNVTVQRAWNGIYMRGSSFQVDRVNMYAYNIGFDVDQCFNFPSLNDYVFYSFGEAVTGGPTDALCNVFYDGATIAANLGETDGGGFHNLQAFTGIVNLTANWSWGSFTNLMLDGDCANLNVASANGVGFVQIVNCYSSKGAYTIGYPIQFNPGSAGFRGWITNLHTTNASNQFQTILVQNGILSIAGAYLWDGRAMFTGSNIEIDGGELRLSEVQFDNNSGRTYTAHINLAGTGALEMNNCSFLQPAAANAVAINAGASNSVSINNVSWNGWPVALGGGGGNDPNNGATFISPVDPHSMQSGSLSFATFGASSHYCTAYGAYALFSMTDSASNNAAFGSDAGFHCTGSGNLFVGATAGFNAGASSQNTFLGALAGYAVTTGGSNTFIGYNAGNAITTGSGNLYIAAGSDGLVYPATESHVFRLGDNITNVLRATGINTGTPQLFLDWLPSTASYANDAAAAAGGVGPGQLYRNGSAVMCRVA